MDIRARRGTTNIVITNIHDKSNTMSTMLDESTKEIKEGLSEVLIVEGKEKEEETNNTTNQQHGKPSEGMMCLVSMEDITEENQNYVEYQVYPTMKWKPALFEQSVVEELLETQFDNYVEKVRKEDCGASLRRLLEKGPPIYISDEHGFALDDKEEYVMKLWFASDGKERSAKLKNSLEGKEREDLWESLKVFLLEKEDIDG